MTQRTRASFRLTEDVRELLRQLAEELGISQAAVVEQSVRRFAVDERRRLGLEVDREPDAAMSRTGESDTAMGNPAELKAFLEATREPEPDS